MSTYLLRTKPQGEAKAIAGIKRAGADAWTPTEDRVKRAYRYSKKKRVVTVPLAPRYVIASAGHRLVHEIEEVSGVVGRLTDHDIDRLRSMDASKAETTITKSLAVGQNVVVRQGHLKDWITSIDAIKGDTATVTITMLGGPVPVTMPLAYLDPV